jgi:hypothetical protein
MGIKGCVKLKTHFPLMPRTKVRGAIYPFPQYAFMAWCSVKAQGKLYIIYAKKAQKYMHHFRQVRNSHSIPFHVQWLRA